MDFVIAKYRSRTEKRNQKHKLILSNTSLYEKPDNLNSSTVYSAETNIGDFEWFKILSFSTTPYFIEFLSSTTSSIGFSNLDISEASKISYICSCQENCNIFYFQRIQSGFLRKKKAIEIGSTFRYEPNSSSISINNISDAIYVKNEDILYFKNLKTITPIFKGIDTLYREATEEETINFLNSDFIDLSPDFSSKNVKNANRSRIALAIESLDNYTLSEKASIIHNISEYCEDLITSDNKFSVSSEEELELLTYGILQRFYTTAVGGEKRIANSIKRIS